MTYRMGDMNMPGRGDQETWPACTGHPNDPRTPEPPEWEAMTREQQVEDLVQNFSAVELATMYLNLLEGKR